MTPIPQACILAGDIGGTKTRLAIIDVSGSRLHTRAEETYPSQAYDSLDSIIRVFIDAHSTKVDSACFGIAGPVRDNRVTATNLPWQIDAAELSAHYGIARVFLLNDLEANAWGIQVLSPDDIHELQPGSIAPHGNAAIIAAGTGLGEAGMYFDGSRLLPFATEGGHCGFSPATEQEIELLRFLQRQHRHVSWERILSGPGLVHIHDFLRQAAQTTAPLWLLKEMRNGDPAAVISTAAQAGRDTVCGQALQLFIHLYGVEAGNLALKHMATGGLYIGGGIAPQILDGLIQGDFIAGFLGQGRMRPLLEQMPVRVILNDRTALYGPAVYAATQAN